MSAFKRFSKRIKPHQRVHHAISGDGIIPYSVKQVAKNSLFGIGKPTGLWYSCGNSWLEWCLAESFGFGPFVYELELDTSRIKFITGLKEFDEFSDEYGMEREEFFGLPKTTWASHREYDCINWPKVESDGFTGIEINPYLWARRLEGGMWYYGWDCASGCVWDANAVKSVKLIARLDRNRVRVR